MLLLALYYHPTRSDDGQLRAACSEPYVSISVAGGVFSTDAGVTDRLACAAIIGVTSLLVLSKWTWNSLSCGTAVGFCRET